MAGNTEQAFFDACEAHDATAVRTLLDGGLDPRRPLRGQAPIAVLTEMYLRSDGFVPCLRLLLERGAVAPEPALLPALLDDADAVRTAHAADPAWRDRRFDLPCAFTPLVGATPLHVAAEYGQLAAVRALLALGADPNAPAGFDADGLGGQTPLFHAVCAHRNFGLPVLKALLAAGARPDARVPGLAWGRGYEWETLLFDLTPISYAQCGSLPQFQRDEADLAANVAILLAAAGRPVPAFGNVPNRYLRPKS